MRRLREADLINSPEQGDLPTRPPINPDPRRNRRRPGPVGQTFRPIWLNLPTGPTRPVGRRLLDSPVAPGPAHWKPLTQPLFFVHYVLLFN